MGDVETLLDKIAARVQSVFNFVDGLGTPEAALEYNLLVEVGDDLIPALRAALQSVKVGAWQTIDTAPKDGKILAFRNDESQYMAVCSWVSSPGNGGFLVDDYHGGMFHPTHWMPLPKPPGESA